MADPTTTRSVITAEVDAVYQRTLLERVVAGFHFRKWGQVRNIQRNAGTDTARFRRYGNLTAATTALTEGVTPAGSQLSITNITAQALQYGDFVILTDVVQFETQDPLLTETVEIQGDQAADTFDQLTRDVLAAGTGVRYANGAVSRVTTSSNVLLVDYRKIARTLAGNNAKKVTRMITAGTGVNTTPIYAAYIVIISPSTHYDLKSLSGFVPVKDYPSTTTVLEDEVGSIDEFRFIQTTNAKVFSAAGAAGVDIHADIIIAQNAYGITQIEGEALKAIYKPLGSGGTNDALDQRSTQGWKGTFVAKRLNENFLHRYEHAVSS